MFESDIARPHNIFFQSCGESSSHPIDGNPYGLFTAALCEGLC
ncbi:hypothetical protein ES705_30735 [subsurface metagenome]